MTTRNENLALMVTTSRECRHTLGLLSDDDCWSLFMGYASGFAAIVNPEYMGLIQQKVIKEIQGLPLPVKNLANTFYSMKINEWLENPETWEVMDAELFEAFHLSYRYLPLHLKICFAYLPYSQRVMNSKRKKLFFYGWPKILFHSRGTANNKMI